MIKHTMTIAEAYEARQNGTRWIVLAQLTGLPLSTVFYQVNAEKYRRLRLERPSLLPAAPRATPATHLICTELADGWHGYWRDYHVGPCTDYAATVQALQDALDARLMPREAA